MSSKDQDTVPEKIQEALFNDILKKTENFQCADCSNKGPTWASIDFGVLVCIRCSGVHRQLGPHITRVRSTKLDKWKREQIEILSYVGNKLANDYYEYQLPGNFKRIGPNTGPEECARFVRDKYLKKLFAPKDYQTPVEEFHENKKNGMKVDLTVPKENPTRHAPTPHSHHSHSLNGDRPVVRKKSLSLDNPHHFPPKNNTKETSHTHHASDDLLSGGEHTHHNNHQKKDSAGHSFEFFGSFDNINSNSQQNGSTTNSKPSSAFDFDFSAIQTKNPDQNQNTQQNTQNQNSQGLNNVAFSQSPQQQTVPEKKEANPLDIKKLYQQPQPNMYGNFAQPNPMMMMNNNNQGFNNFPQNQQFGFNNNNFPQNNNQGWNNGMNQMNNANMMGGFNNNMQNMQNMNGGGFNQNFGMNMNMNMGGGQFGNSGYPQQQQFMNQMGMNNNFSQQQNMQNAQMMQKNFF